MYRFEKVNNIEEMKDISMYIRSYNEFKSKNKNVLESELAEFIKKNYRKSITIEELNRLDSLVKEVAKVDEIPKLSALDDIINSYINYSKEKATSLHKTLAEKEIEFEDKKHVALSKYAYSSKEILTIEKPVNKQVSSIVSVFLTGMLLLSIAITLASYPLLLLFKPIVAFATTTLRWILVFVIVYLVSVGISFLIFYFIMGKKLRISLSLYSLVSTKYVTAKNEENQLSDAENEYKKHIGGEKFLLVNGGQFSGEDKMFYYLRTDATWGSRESVEVKKVQEKNEEEFKREDLKNNVIAVKDETSNMVKIESWSDEKSAEIEKNLICKDLIGRVDLIIESLKANKQESSKEFAEVTDIFVEKLSVEEREKNVVEQENQLLAYKFYLNIVDLLDKYEKICKDSYGIDYNSESYSYRIATEEEKRFILDYIFKIVNNMIVKDDLKNKKKNKLYNLFNSIKQQKIGKITYRTDLYKLYFKFLEDFAKLS